MPEISASERSDSVLHLTAERLLIILLMVGLYSLLMLRYPIIYGGDTIIRLVNYPRILIGHQLPLLQVLIHYTMRWYYGPAGIFMLMALISAAACAGIHALTLAVTNLRRAAWFAAILYATHPFILYYSRVPYQESLLLAGMAWGFYYLFLPARRTNLLLSSLCFGVASFSRYEGWIAALAAAGFLFWRYLKEEGKFTASSLLQPVLLFGWAPAAWIAWNKGISPEGTYVLDASFQWERLYRSYFIAKSSLWWTESAVTLLALIGFVYSLLDKRTRRTGMPGALLGLIALVLGALVFSGHGLQPDATRIVTEREAFIPISIMTLFAGSGASLLLGRFVKRLPHASILSFGIPSLAVALAAGYSLDRGIRRISASNEDAALKTDYQVARFLAGRGAVGLILAAPLPAQEINRFLNIVERGSGPAGREQALRALSQVETTPLDYQRVLLFSWLGKDRVLPGDRLTGFDRPGIESFLRRHRIDYLVVFSDFIPAAEHEKIVMSSLAERRAPEIEISNGSKTARLYLVRSSS